MVMSKPPPFAFARTGARNRANIFARAVTRVFPNELDAGHHG
jgi:hypothetical protein